MCKEICCNIDISVENIMSRCSLSTQVVSVIEQQNAAMEVTSQPLQKVNRNSMMSNLAADVV